MQLRRWIHPLLLIVFLGSAFTLARVAQEPVGGADDVTEDIRARLYSGNPFEDALVDASFAEPFRPTWLTDPDDVGEDVDGGPPAADHPAAKTHELIDSAAAEPTDGSADNLPLLPEVIIHVVQANETLSDIARKYGIKLDTIIAANAIHDPDRIRVGDELRILTQDGVLHRIQPGESLWEISRRYNVSIEEIAAINRIPEPSRITAGTEIFLPGAEAARAQQYREAVVDASGRLIRNFSWPVQGPISSSFGPRWGRMHQGIDIAVVTGTPVRAAASGRVSFAGENGGYGLLVIIDHGNGVETRYAHNSQLLVKVGDRVQRGQVIARSGNTGNSTGPHLHFEIRQYGQAVDPLLYLR